MSSSDLGTDGRGEFIVLPPRAAPFCPRTTPSVPQPRVERVAERVGEDLQRQHEAEERDAREGDLPPLARHEAALGELDEDAPGRLVLDADAEERQYDLGLDRLDEEQA